MPMQFGIAALDQLKGSSPCQGGANKCTLLASSFRDALATAWSCHLDVANGQVKRLHFLPKPAGDMQTRAEDMDLMFFASHGGTTLFANGDGAYSGKLADSAACDWSSTNAKFGAHRLKWLALYTCDSLRLWPRPPDPKKPDIPSIAVKTWSQSFHGLHQVLGFNDLATIDSPFLDVKARGESIASRLLDGEAVSSAWIWGNFWSGVTGDQPVALAAGISPADARSRIETETVAATGKVTDPTHCAVRRLALVDPVTIWPA